MTGYALNNGRVMTGYSADTLEMLMSLVLPGQELVGGEWDGERYYIDLTDPDNPTPTERPTSPVSRTDASAPLSTGLTLLAVPEGSTLWINGESYEAEGEVELEFPLPGTYRLRVECFPFLDWTDEVTVP